MPVKQSSIIGDIMRNSGPAGAQARRSRGSSVPAWREKLSNDGPIKASATEVRRNKSSIWDDSLPTKRHTRRLSSSSVGLSGGSPTYVEMRSHDHSIEAKRLDEIKMKLELGSIEDLWNIYMQSSAWHQEDHPWPVQNHEFVKVRKRLAGLLKLKMKQALESDQAEDMEAAIREADGKVQILHVLGNHKFPELDKIFDRLEKKQKEQREFMSMLAKSNSSNMSYAERQEAEKALEEALKTKDIAKISPAINRCMEGGLNVSKAMKRVHVKSKYFNDEGKREKSLFKQDAFKGEGRMVHVVNLGPEFDINFVERVLGFHGVGVKVHDDIKTVMVGKEDRKSGLRKGTSIAHSLAGQEMKFESKILKEPLLNTIVIISGPEPARLEGDTGSLTKLLKFNQEGGGLVLMGSGNRGGNSFPLIQDVNLVLKVFGYDKVWGHDAAGKVLKRQEEPGKVGMSSSHPLFDGLDLLNEGYSVTSADESMLRKGFRELIRSSNGKLLTCMREPSDAFSVNKAGPLMVHCSPVQLLCSKESVGAEEWAGNMLLYMCLRTGDVTEEFH